MLLFRSALLIGAAVATLQNPAADICSLCDCKSTEVDCSDKKFSSYPSFEKVTDATTIFFGHCSFANIQQLPKLAVRNLSFAYNDVVKLEDAAFKNLASLQNLDLSHNLLSADSLLPNVFRVSISVWVSSVWSFLAGKHRMCDTKLCHNKSNFVV